VYTPTSEVSSDIVPVRMEFSNGGMGVGEVGKKRDGGAGAGRGNMERRGAGVRGRERGMSSVVLEEEELDREWAGLGWKKE